MYAGDFDWKSCVMCNYALIKFGGEILFAVLTGVVGSFVYAWIESEKKKERDRKRFSFLESKSEFDWKGYEVSDFDDKNRRPNGGKATIKYESGNKLRYEYHQASGEIYRGFIYMLDESSGKITFDFDKGNYAGQTFIIVGVKKNGGGDEVFDSIYKISVPEAGIGNELWLRKK